MGSQAWVALTGAALVQQHPILSLLPQAHLALELELKAASGKTGASLNLRQCDALVRFSTSLGLDSLLPGTSDPLVQDPMRQ